MAKLNALGSPGVYAITFEDETYNPGTKIVEGTTGQRYASNYMGARSRWWDVSMKQAAYEMGQEAAARKAVQAELVEIQKTRAKIQQDFAKRYDSMRVHNDKMEADRLKFNASIGDRVTTVAGTRAGRSGSRSGDTGPERNMAILGAVQTALVDSPSVNADAAEIEALTEDASLYGDEYSRDYAAYAAIENRIEKETNELVGQNVGVPIESLRTRATESVLDRYDKGTKEAKAMAARFRDVSAKITADPTGRTYGYTKTVTSGKTPLGEREALPTEAVDTTALDEREAELREKLAEPDTDLIGRARRIQREKFGPSITQALRELPGNIRERRQARQLNRELQAIERFLDAGGTVEELQRFTAEPEVTVERKRLPPERAPTVPGVRPGVGQVPGRFTPPGRFLEGDLTPPRPPAPVGPPRVEPTITETTPATGPARVLPVRVQPERMSRPGARRQIVSEGQGFGIRDPFMFDIPSPDPLPQINLDEELGDTPLEAMPQLEKMELTSPGREAKPQPGTRKLPKDKPKQRKAKPSDAAQHRAGLLQGFVGASTLLEKPRALDRKTANAESGSPQQFARAIIDAERGKSTAERRPLKELVANVAQQYNQMGDKAGRDAALENTIALYKLFLDEQSLLG